MKYCYSIVNKHTKISNFNCHRACDTEQEAKAQGEAKRLELYLSAVNYEIIINPVADESVPDERYD